MGGKWYQAEAFEIVDYDLFRIDGSNEWFRGPSFDLSGQRFSFILVTFLAYFLHVLCLFREAFCVLCACSFDLVRNRLDLDLVLRRSIGEACSIRRSTYWML